MNTFKKDNFKFEGGYLTYNKKFVARFKYTRLQKSYFVNVLIKYFEIDEYFKMLNSGITPSKILQSKGINF